MVSQVQTTPGDGSFGVMTWDEHFRRWSEQHEPEPRKRMAAARKRIARNTPDDWRWLAEGLDDPERKWFVASLFEFHTLPRRLLGPMLRAGVLERSPSANRYFIRPCVRSFGGRRVLEVLLRYLESGTDAEKAGAASAVYWAEGDSPAEDLRGLRQQIRCQMLREFVANEELEVRRRIIPMLHLEPGIYPLELRPMVARAVEIARAHPDPYIRHRVEVQLGADVPLKPIPDTGARGAVKHLLERIVDLFSPPPA